MSSIKNTVEHGIGKFRLNMIYLIWLIYPSIVGRDFGSHVTHVKGHFIHFQLREHDIILFKSG